MAKRKRLSPAPVLRTEAPETKAVTPGLGAQTAFGGPEAETPSAARRAPIADVAGDAATRAALDDLSQTVRDARTEGRMILRLALDDIDETYLMRDRMVANDAEMRSLKTSVAARGQQVAIEVADLGEDHIGPRWGLISGWRRLTALRQLRDETSSRATTDTVLAIERRPRESADAYLAMVEENEIRVGLSHYERARIVVRSVDRGVYANDTEGLRALFGAVSRPKRSKIGSFMRLVRQLDTYLRFPAAIPERLGLALVKKIDAEPEMTERIAAALATADPRTEAGEVAVLEAVLAPPRPEKPVRLQRAVDISVSDGADDTLILSGEAVTDPAFRVRLERWLDRL